MREERQSLARAWRALIGIAGAISSIANVGAAGAAEIILSGGVSDGTMRETAESVALKVKGAVRVYVTR